MRDMGSEAAFFDLDKTIIAKSSALAFSKPFQAGGLISRRAVLRSAYAQFVFLVGGAIKSAVQFWRRRETRFRAEGNALIAVGALLPGIGGSFTRFGYTEVLYVTEFLGIILIYLGYRRATRTPAVPEPSTHDVPYAAPVVR